MDLSQFGWQVRHYVRRAGLAFAVAVMVSPAVLFFLWMLSLAFKTEVDNAAYPPVFIPDRLTFANFESVFKASPFFQYFINTVIVSGGATALALLLGVPAGYGISRANAKGLAVGVLIARITPGLSYLIPLFILFQFVGLTGTLWPLVIIHLVITLPIVVWVMIGFFDTLPAQLEEAAIMDGCSEWQAFRYIALPLSRPGIVVSAILSVIFSWNNFIFGVVLAGRETRTLPVAVYNVLSFDQLSWGPLAAAGLLVTLPVLILTVFVQRDIVAGMTAGGVKN
jgi:multiple sugar transport system permease protein